MKKTTFSYTMRRVWLRVSRRILKPYFGIETATYLRWHESHARKIQIALDKEHNVSPLTISVI